MEKARIREVNSANLLKKFRTETFHLFIELISNNNACLNRATHTTTICKLQIHTTIQMAKTDLLLAKETCRNKKQISDYQMHTINFWMGSMALTSQACRACIKYKIMGALCHSTKEEVKEEHVFLEMSIKDYRLS